MSKNNICKQLQTSVSKIIAPIIVKVHMKHDQTLEFQNYKVGSGQESKTAPLLKIAKTGK